MRPYLILALVTLLGIAPLGGLTTVAQESTYGEAWANVAITLLDSDDAKEPLRAFLGAASGDVDVEGGLVERLGAYEVDFTQQLAQVPDVGNAEFMIVIVQTDGFILHVFEETLIVDPMPPRTIEILKGTEVITPGGHEIFYQGTNTFLPDEKGEDCTELCTVLPGTPILLAKGDRIIAPAGHKCYYCLLNGDAGSLLVYPLLRTDTNGNQLAFSWLESLDASAVATPTTMAPAQNDMVLAPAASGMMGWAFFNPAPNCRSGPH